VARNVSGSTDLGRIRHAGSTRIRELGLDLELEVRAPPHPTIRPPPAARPTVASPRTEPNPLEELASAVSHQSTPPKRHPMAGPATVAAALPGRERRQAGLDRPGGPYGRCGRRWQRWTGIRRPPELAAQARGSRFYAWRNRKGGVAPGTDRVAGDLDR